MMLKGENSEVLFATVAVDVIKLPLITPEDSGIVNLNLLVLSVLPSKSVYEVIPAALSAPLPSIKVAR